MDDDFIQLKQPSRIYSSTQIKCFLSNSNKSHKNINFVDHLNDELILFLDFLKPSVEEKILRKVMVEKVKNIIIDDIRSMIKNLNVQYKKDKNITENVSVECFGSYETDLFLPGSDIDMTLFTDYEDALKELKTTLAENPLILPKSIIYLSKAKIPILRFMDICFFRYDLCLNQKSGIIQAEFVKKVLTEKPFLKEMVLFLKYFLKIRELNESRRGGLCSYAQFLMICNFCNLHPLIQRGIKFKKNFAIILLDFFQFYGFDFPYQNTTICFDEYKEKDITNFLSIEDPTDIENNVGHLSSNMNAIKDVFAHSFKIMVNLSKEKHGNKYCVLPIWVKIGEFEISWRENVRKFYDKIVVKNEI